MELPEPAKLPPLAMKNIVQNYAWGSRSAIQSLLGKKPTEEPWAELWMGAHPKAPSKVRIKGKWMPLNTVIEKWPEKMLGAASIKKFGPSLPYLFKLLAAAQPLSIQAHPNARQAKTGYARESEAGIDMAAPFRNYRDASHKPECICALTEFIGLKGFREIADIDALIDLFCPKNLSRPREFLKQGDLKKFFNSVMTMSGREKRSAIGEAAASARKAASEPMTAEWILRLQGHFPDDIGVLSPLFLNLFRLAPGEALFLAAGELHAYLYGFGIEIMANSDNVLRGGLTPKHVDVPELLSVLDFRESRIHVLTPAPVSDCEKQYPVLSEEFALSAIHVRKGFPCVFDGPHSAEILICTDGDVSLSISGFGNDDIKLRNGASVFIPAETGPYSLAGNARLFKAGVPA